MLYTEMQATSSYIIPDLTVDAILTKGADGSDISPLRTHVALFETNISLFVRTAGGVKNVQVRYFSDSQTPNVFIDIYYGISPPVTRLRREITLNFVPASVTLNDFGQLVVNGN